MGSRIMEPYDAADYAETMLMHGYENITKVCTSMNRIYARGSALDSNPLTFALPLLLAQFSLASTSTLFSALILKPLGQPLFAAQMLGGIIAGPSVLGKIEFYLEVMFPLRSFVMLDLLSSMAFMMYMFLVGAEIDTAIMTNINKRAVVTGLVSAVVPLGLTEAFSLALVKNVYIDAEVIRKIPIAAQVQSALAVPTVACLLEELNMTNSELGRTAIRSSLVSGMFGFAATFSVGLAGESLQDKTAMITTLAAGLVFTAVIVFAVRPGIVFVMRRFPLGGRKTRDHFVGLALIVLLTGFCSHVAGLHLYYGPFVLGLIVPVEPAVSFWLKEKLGCVVKWMLLPFFFLKNGLIVDVFSVRLKNYAILQSIALVAAFGKFGGAFAAFVFYKTSTVDAVVLGLVMAAQGLFELGIIKMMKKSDVIDNEIFVIMCVSMLLITGFIVPAIKWLYDPSRRYMVYKRRTVTSSGTESELRLLICLHGEDQVPTAINFLETLNPTSETPLDVIVLHLVEQLGVEKSHLVPYKGVERLSFHPGPSDSIVKAFKAHEQSNPELISVSAFTGTTQAAKMHDYACSLAIDERISLIVVPYSRKFHPRKTRHKASAVMNKNLIEKSPCSVGILVDRGLLESSSPAVSVGAWSSFRVGVVFLGGEDDREALAIGERIAEHPSIQFMVIRLLVSGNVAGNDTGARRLDNEALSSFRQSMAGNSRVTYIEEVVTDWSGTVAVIQSMEGKFELVLVGQAHDRQSPLLSGLAELRENSELGAIGQILISPDFRDKATVLVVQQQNSPPRDCITSPRQSLGSKISKKYEQSEASFQSKSPIRGDDKSKSLEDDDSDDSSSDITCIIKGDASRSHLKCPMASESSEESAKNFSNMRWVYEPVTPQSNWQSDSKAATKRPAPSTDYVDFQGNCVKASRLY